MPQTILVVEDEAEILELLGFTLRNSGYEVLPAASAEQALKSCEKDLPSLAVIDWMLPGMTGVELVRRLRRDEFTEHLPIIMLTALGEERDKLQSFDVGVDDYMTKPFSPKELLARIKVLLRRSGASTEERLIYGPLCMDVSQHQVTINDHNIHLGPTEFRLLELFMRNPGRVFERAQLLDRVWGRNTFIEERTVDVHVLRLRKQLQPHNLSLSICTVRGVGYRFAATD